MPTIKVYFEDAKDYKLIPVTGAWGGVSPNGEIIIDFYVERQTAPKSVTLDVDDSGKVDEKSREGQKYVREKQFGIVVRPDIALSIGKLLTEKAQQIVQKKRRPN